MSESHPTAPRLPISRWPEQERPREKMIRHGAPLLTDAELLSLLIGCGTRNHSALDLAKHLLVEFESLYGMTSSALPELCRIRGIGAAAAARIQAAFEIGRRVQGRAEKRRRFQYPGEIAAAVGPGLRDARREVFRVLLLNSDNRMIRDVTISQGTLNASLVHPREVFKAAVDYLAAGIILVHNHPSGNPEPSVEDRRVTRQVVEAGELMGIPVLDHIIIAGEDYFSFAAHGILKESRK